MLARIFVIVGGLIVLALCAALVGPYFINWTSYRSDFEREASAILGRPVKVNGDANARILPFPSVTFTDVSIGGGDEGTPATTVEEFSMDAELAPFLSGEILIFDMRLVRPRTVAWVDSDGKFNWAVDPRAPVSPSQVALERVTVTEGQVRLVASGVPDRILSEINVVASARSLAGPWRTDGSLRANGRKMKVGFSTGIASADGMRARLRVEPETTPVALELDGNVTTKAGALAYGGNFRLTDRVTVVEGLRGADGQAVESSGPGNRVSGSFSLDDKRLAVEEFRFETGPLDDPYVATGTGGMEFGRAPSFSIKATGAQVRLGADQAAETGPVLTMSDRLDQAEAAILELPAPIIPGTVDVELPAVVTGNTTIRDVALTASTDGSGWQVKRLSAKLPGRSTLEASGRVVTSPSPGFDGKLVLAVSQPSGFANWLASDIEAPLRRLARAGFSAEMKLKREEQTFDKLELALGAARLTGSARRTAKSGETPVLSAKLEGGAIGADEVTALRSLLFADDGAARLSDHEIDLQVKAGPVGTGPLMAGGVDAALRIAGSTVDIDRLSVTELADASIALTGKIEALDAAPQGKIDATIVSTDLAPLARMAAGLLPDNRLLRQIADNASAFPALLLDTRMDILATAFRERDADRLEFDVTGKAGGSDVSAKIGFKGSIARAEDAALSIQARFANPDATALMALAGIPSLPLDLVGPGQAIISASGSIAKGLETSATAEGKDSTASFGGTILAPRSGLQARGKLTVDAADIEPWLMTAGMALPGMGTGMETALSAEVDYANGLLVASKLSGTVSENAVSGDVNVELKSGTPTVTGALVTDELQLGPLAQMVLGVEAFDSVADGWPTKPFQQSRASSLNLDLDINTGTLSAGPQATGYDAALSLKLDDDGLRIPKLTAKIGDGVVSGLFELKNSAATGLFSGQFKLSGGKLDSLLPLMGAGDTGLSGVTDISGTISGSGKTVGAVVASLAGSGTISVNDLTISTLNPAAFPELIKAADSVGRDIDAARVAGFAPTLVRSGTFNAGDAEIPFSMAGGVLRLPPVSLGGKQMTLTGDLKFDATTLDIASSGRVTYAPGDDALVGAEPTAAFSLAGKIGNTALSLDTQPLAQFLTQRALEIEQARVEHMQAVLLEKQRLRREARYYAALDLERQRAADEQRRVEEAKATAERQARLEAEEEARAKVEEARQQGADTPKPQPAADPEPQRQAPARSPRPVPSAPGLF